MPEAGTGSHGERAAQIEKEIAEGGYVLYVEGQRIDDVEFTSADQKVSVCTHMVLPDKIEVEINGERYDITKHYDSLTTLSVVVDIPYDEWLTN